MRDNLCNKENYITALANRLSFFVKEKSRLLNSNIILKANKQERLDRYTKQIEKDRERLNNLVLYGDISGKMDNNTSPHLRKTKLGGFTKQW